MNSRRLPRNSIATQGPDRRTSRRVEELEAWRGLE
jgi:hypothetical protein